MSTPIKPTIVLIPASFSPVSLYDAVISNLESHGYAVHGVEHQTVGRREKAPTMYDDAKGVADVVGRLVDEGKDVALVAHSYGGTVACEAAKGLAKSVREREGKSGGIVRIIFVAACVPMEGKAMMEVFGEGMVSHAIKVEMVGEYLVLDKATCATGGYSDLPHDEALVWASKMREHAAASFSQKITYAAYKDIPATYLFCEEDRGVIPEAQDKIIADMESQMGGQKVQKISVKSGHHINASQPETMATVIRKALGDVA
ncbi:AB hydrolase-1 domain-containing protein [Favolaschia claudopus]|uniref:AB hydrolase-1 domain-containing protein n=1 Tax=Favolaschia claudopus TaxID=2862362 RepID=A0AAW0CML6_9AGAR